MEIRLTDSQDDLLRWIDVQLRKLPEAKRTFIAAVNDSGDFIEVGGERRGMLYSDLMELARKGLVSYRERGQVGDRLRPVAEYGTITADGIDYLTAPPLGIQLEDEVQELLIKMVEMVRNTPRSKRGRFMLIATFGGSTLMAPNNWDEDLEVYEGDLDALEEEGLLRSHLGSDGRTVSYDVTQRGVAYYEAIKKRDGEAADRVVRTIREYIDTTFFRLQHPASYEKWSGAEDLLWGADSQRQLTTIGHLCRESIQEFATELIARFNVANVDPDKAHDVARMKAVLSARRETLGTTEAAHLDALLPYWGTLSDLAQRQVHGSQREGTPLVWEDARRLVFQSLVVMHGAARALGE